MPQSGTPRSTGSPAPSRACCCATISRPNIIWRGEKSGNDRLGLIDFQDALIGPSAYDVASLAMDARVTVSPEIEQRTVAAYVARQAGCRRIRP